MKPAHPMLSTLVLIGLVPATHAADALAPGDTRTYQATVLDQFGHAIASPAVSWSASGGTLSSASGASTRYTAGGTAGTYRIQATSGGLVATRAIAIAASSTVASFQETGGLVVMEAENATGTVAGSGAAAGSVWRIASSSGTVSGRALRAEPNAGVNVGDGTNGPRLDYRIHFSTPGTYTVHVRGRGDSNQDDSVHVGLDGVPATFGGFGVTSFAALGTWGWQRLGPGGRRMIFTVTAPGSRVLSVWMREDGVYIDKIIATTDSAWRPSGLGPAESGLLAPTGNG